VSESELIQRAKERDASAWATWYDRYHLILFRYAYAKLGRKEDAEDLASQVFVEALKSIDRFSERGRPILAWLYGIARKLISAKLRQEARASRANVSLSTLPEERRGPEAVLDRIALREALRQLTQDQQDVIILRFFLSMSTREIGEILNKTENAVSVLQFRALNALRRQLSPEEIQAVKNAASRGET
jgi:RNA polymerase sigma-70 factor (ECF subfamily)